MDDRKKLSPKDRLAKRDIFRSAKPAVGIKRGDHVRGEVYNVTEDGAFVLTADKHIGFIHNSEHSGQLTKGMSVEARVTFVRADGRINLSLRPQKEHARIVDAERILEYIKKREGSMPFNDLSPAAVIKERFGISKAAFKRALGKLLKDGLVEEKEGWIVLVNQGQ